MKITSLLFILTVSNLAFGYKSNHMKKFELMQCYAEGCVRIEGPIGFMSMNKDSIAATDVTIELAGKSFSCQNFRFQMKSQFITCDNSLSDIQPTFTIDSKFKITTLSKRAL